MKKIFCLISVLLCGIIVLTGCDDGVVLSQERIQIEAAQEVAGNIVEKSTCSY